MSLDSLYQRIATTAFSKQVTAWCEAARPPASLYLKGAIASLPAFLLRRIQADVSRPMLCILPEAEGAAYLHSDLEQLGLIAKDLLLFPPTGHTPYDQEQIADAVPIIQRGDVLQQLADGFSGLLITSLSALYELVPPADTVQEETLQLNVGDEIAPETLLERLTTQGFERTEFVQQPGELAWRGGILDVFPFAGDYPIRIEFFGDEIDSLREFDAKTQRSISRLTTARIVPNLERSEQVGVSHISLFDYLPTESLVATFDEDGFGEQLEALFQVAEAGYERAIESRNTESASSPSLPAAASRYLNADAFTTALMRYPRLLFGTFAGQQAGEMLVVDAKPHPAFHGNLEQLRRRILDNAKQHTDTVILCNSRGQEARLYSLLEEEAEGGQVRLRVESMHEGFELPELGLAIYTDHQIFNRYFRPTARKRAKQKGGLSLRELHNLSPGDFVVHIDYGIGKFAGMEHITVREKQQEAVRVLFLGGDTLYVNVNALHKLHKYTGKEGHQPRLTKLGSGQWERTKKKTKKRVKDIARDLIKLYARRKASKGFAFSGDTVWQREMEVSFPFEDTPDQGTAAAAVKSDMEESVPMDRLVCGDVGFGKTEVAVRAAFKAVQDGKQVAVLVPTTILAAQHHQTFMKRLDSFPVRVEMVADRRG